MSDREITGDIILPQQKEFKYSWLLGPLLAFVMTLLAGAIAYGELTQTTENTEQNVIKLDTKVEAHVIDNNVRHNALEIRMRSQEAEMLKRDTVLMEQSTILRQINKKLDEVGKDIKDHIKEH